MNIGDKVKPVETFDFTFNGPKRMSDTGEVVGFDHEGDPRVKWPSGEIDVHVTPDSKFHLQFVDEKDPLGPFGRFGVVPV